MLRSPETAPVAWDVLPLDGEQEEEDEEGGNEHEREREREEEVKKRGRESGKLQYLTERARDGVIVRVK